MEMHSDRSNAESEVENTPTETAIERGYKPKPPVQLKLPVPIITIDVEPPTPDDNRQKTPRPRDLIIPTLMIQTPSPTKEQRLPVIIFPGSPPPQRASIGETSFMFPNKQQQKRYTNGLLFIIYLLKTFTFYITNC